MIFLSLFFLRFFRDLFLRRYTAYTFSLFSDDFRKNETFVRKVNFRNLSILTIVYRTEHRVRFKRGNHVQLTIIFITRVLQHILWKSSNNNHYLISMCDYDFKDYNNNIIVNSIQLRI